MFPARLLHGGHGLGTDDAPGGELSQKSRSLWSGSQVSYHAPVPGLAAMLSGWTLGRPSVQGA